MTTYALDSNIISYIIRENGDVITRYHEETGLGNELIIPPVVYYEVQRWLLAKSLYSKKRAFDNFCQNVEVGNFDFAVWNKASEIYADLCKQGKLADDADIFIAAFCLVNGYTLVTNNVRHFENISGLNIVNWKN
ncbi:MAG: PIN domain-containing protein [Clostridiales bacterium]|jgi:predicted nucleic acid-binding protein|nr:PIN domain-containing protein [Clostridiales bacterium]